VWTEYAKPLEEEIAEDDEAREIALAALRHDEAFEAVASLLESSIQKIDSDEWRKRRSLRLELTAVCRTALSEPSRALTHLRRELERDRDDREVWGELLECLEEAEDPSLVNAIEARTQLVSGIE